MTILYLLGHLFSSDLFEFQQTRSNNLDLNCTFDVTLFISPLFHLITTWKRLRWFSCYLDCKLNHLDNALVNSTVWTLRRIAFDLSQAILNDFLWKLKDGPKKNRFFQQKNQGNFLFWLNRFDFWRLRVSFIYRLNETKQIKFLRGIQAFSSNH